MISTSKMSEKVTKPKPIALFDTLERIDSQKLPEYITLPFAENDFLATKSFLKEYSNNDATFVAYRREIERFLQWVWLISEKSILTLKRIDIEAYIAFCQKPPKRWIGLSKQSRFITQNADRIPNPKWRCFVATLSKREIKSGQKPTTNDFHLSQASLSALFASLKSFYNYCIDEGLTEINPVGQIRQKSQYLRKQQSKRKIRRLNELQWSEVIKMAECMAIDDPIMHERTFFIMNILYLLCLRISELTVTQYHTPTMGDFYRDSDNRWWFKTVSKGNKARDIPVPNEMLVILKRYRRYRKLSPVLPLSNDSTPLLLSTRSNTSITSDRPIRTVVQQCFDATVEKLMQDGFNEDANALENATVHWLRHTGISDDINKRKRPIAHVRDDVGHSSSAITDLYNDIETHERHASARRKKTII